MSDVEVFTGLIGKTCVSVKEVNAGVVFVLEDGEEWYMFHSFKCCERVDLEEVIGDLEDLEGSPLTMAEVTSNGSADFEWVFYKFRTQKGDVTFRWCADLDSNYSTEVEFRSKSSLNGQTPWECKA